MKQRPAGVCSARGILMKRSIEKERSRRSVSQSQSSPKRDKTNFIRKKKRLIEKKEMAPKSSAKK